MLNFLQYLVSLIIEHPQELKITEKVLGDHFYQYTVSTNKEDMGKVIGKEGKVIQAIRNVAKIIAIKEGNQVRIEVV